MGGIGGPELFLVFVVVLLVFGPRKIPEIARTMGKAMREFRRMSTEFQREINIADALEGKQDSLPGGPRMKPSGVDWSKPASPAAPKAPTDGAAPATPATPAPPVTPAGPAQSAAPAAGVDPESATDSESTGGSTRPGSEV